MVCSRNESESDWLHHLTYIEKQCEKRLEYIAHGELWIIRSSVKTLLALIGSCQEFWVGKFEEKFFRIVNLTNMCRLTWRKNVLEVTGRVNQGAMRRACGIRAGKRPGRGNRSTKDVNLEMKTCCPQNICAHPAELKVLLRSSMRSGSAVFNTHCTKI